MASSFGEDVKYEVCFIQTGSSPDEATDNLKLAFDAMDSNQLEPTWIVTEECIKMTKKEPKLFVADPFEGEAYEHLKSVQCRIVGPHCILYCLQYSDYLPKRPHPVYSVSMRKITVSCSNIDSKHREDISQKVQLMGGFFSKDLTKSVTHLVVGEVGSKKYQVAANFGLPIMLPEWVDDVWNIGQYKQLHATDGCYDQYKCPIFKGLVVTVSQLSSEERMAIKSIIEDNGGSYCGALKAHETTHLVLSEPVGDKYRYAKSWKVFCVNVNWIYESVEAGYCRDEALYALDESKYVQPKRSTPKKNTACEFPIVDCSAIASTSAVTHLDETTTSESTVPLYNKKSSSFSVLDELNISTLPKYGQFLDGCKIFLSGFNQAHMDKLRKIVNSGGGMRFSKYSDSISHVVCGDMSEDLLQSLKSSSVKPYVINYNWLLECCKKEKLVDEKPFLCMDISPLSPEKNEQQVKSDASANFTSNTQSKKEQSSHDNMTDIFKQYINDHLVDNYESENNGKSVKEVNELKAELGHPSTKQSMSHHKLEETHVKVPQETGADVDEIHDGDAAAGSEELFAGLKFVVVGFGEKDADILSHMIEAHSGTVLSSIDDSSCDIAVFPLIWHELSLPVPHTVTNCWLQKCIEECRLLDFDENELFKPFSVPGDKNPFESFVISVSQYSGTERDCLMYLAECLGATCQEYFVRKANKAKGVLSNTHLIVATPEGSKYEAAKKWKIPAVSKQWVIDAAKSGMVPSVDKYLVDVNLLLENEKKTELVLTTHSVKENDTRKDVIEKPTGNHVDIPPPHHRVSELCNESKMETINTTISPRQKTEISLNGTLDLPSNFKFHVSGLLNDLDASASQESFCKSKRQSLPVEEMFSKNLASALRRINNKTESQSDVDKEEIMKRSFVDDPTKPLVTSGVLSGVVLCVARKLANLQNELNEIAICLGGDYIWSYDSTCTHLVFLGKSNDLTKEFREAKNDGKKIVSPEWLYACREKNLRLEEDLYPHTLKTNMTLTDQISFLKCPASKDESVTQDTGEKHLSKEMPSGESNPVDFNKQLNELLVAAKSAKKRQSKRLSNSISSSPANEISPVQKIHRHLSDAYIKAISEKDKAPAEEQDTCSQHSQSYPITWDDPTGRLEREKIAARSANNAQVSAQQKEVLNIDCNDFENCEENSDIIIVNPSEPEVKKFMFTNISDPERSEYIKIIKELGGDVSDEKTFDISATHLVLENPIKNEKLLCSVASGKWVVHPHYLLQSRDQKHFVDEEEFEWGGPSTEKFIENKTPSCIKIASCPFRWRVKLHENDKSMGAFQGWKVVVMATDKGKYSTYTKILESGGAEIIPPDVTDGSMGRISHVFVDMKMRSALKLDLGPYITHGIKCVKPEYLAFYLIEEPQPEIDNFIVTDTKEQENSSEPSSKRRSGSTASRYSKRTRLK